MRGIVDGAISHARMVIVIFIVALFAGGVTYVNLPKEADPDIPIPVFGILVPIDGGAAEDVQRLIVKPAENELQSLDGLKQLDGYAIQGVGQLVLEFTLTTDPETARADLDEKLDLAKRDFPEDALEPVIQEVNPSLFPIMAINLYGDLPERELNRQADLLSDRLENIAGVLEAQIKGKREDVLEIIVDPLKLETYNLSYEEVLRTVSNNNRLVPAGRIDLGDGRFQVKVPGLIKTADDALSLPVIRSGDTVVTIADVATVQRTFKDREETAAFNGAPALSIDIVKRQGANILDTAAEINRVIEELRDTWPPTLQATITSDQSVLIEQQFNGLQSNIVSAVLIVMVIVVGALGLRSAGLVGLAIPSSFVIAFLLLSAFGLTINTMVMFGMVIAVGILVDGAIVVVEYADRKLAEGLPKSEAYALAAKRMFWPIIASNATTLAAFVPFLFWNSLPGKFMSYLPITLIFVLSASLVMALIFLPVLGSIFGGRPKDAGGDLETLSGAEGDPNSAGGWLGGYVKLTRNLIRRPLMVTGAAALIVVSIFVAFASKEHKSEFFIDFEPQQVIVFVRAQGNLSATDEQEIVRRAEARVLGLEEVINVSARSGASQNSLGFGDGIGGQPVDTIGRLLIDVKNSETGPEWSGRASEAAIRTALEDFPGAQIEIQKLEYGPSDGKDIQIALLSESETDLIEAAGLFRDKLDSITGLREIEDTRPIPGIEWQIQVDREEAGRFGVDVAQIGAAVQLVTNGILVGRYRPDDVAEEVDIRMRLPEGERSLDSLDKLRISTREGLVPVSLFVDRVPAQRIVTIQRRDGKRVIELRANTVEQGESSKFVTELRDWLPTADIPSSVEVTFGGADEDTAEAEGFFQVAAIAALFLMAVILLWEFNNVYHVLLTLSAVILSTTGVIIGILTYLPYISYIMLGTGVVALAGIVVNNNIVLIDTYQRLRSEGNRTVDEAALAAAAQRIRPILLTTATTIAGLLPMMLGMNIDFSTGVISFGGLTAEWFVQLAAAVVFGLGFSTVMTLLVTPAWLAAPYRISLFAERIKRLALRRGTTESADPAPQAAE